MYTLSISPRFERDVNSCSKKHWDIASLKQAIKDLQKSDETPLDPSYKDHALVGSFQGYRTIHVNSSPNPPKDQWVLMYKISNSEIALVRTGTHKDVYGK